ncbi:MAG: glycosyltransferase family 4 protein, partial [Thermocrispum sp.]
SVLGLRVVPVAGGWPHPVAADRAALGEVLAALPDAAAVLVDGLVACGVPEVVVPHARRLRLGVLVHLPLPDETGLEPAVAATLARGERETLAAARVVLATSRAAARDLTTRYGLPDVRVVPPGVDRAPATRGSRAGCRLVCVASITPRKGQDVLVDALARVAELQWDLRCAGPEPDGPFAATLRARIELNGLAHRVHLVGAMTGARLHACYDSADLVVLPSYAETYGMVVTEALAHGVPVLVSDVGGVQEALGAGLSAGVLVPPGDVGALAGELRRWLTEPSWRARLRSAALARRGRLTTWEDAAVPLAAALRDLEQSP